MKTRKLQAPDIKRRRGITRINIPYLDRIVAFVYPFEGPDFYTNVAKKILNNKIAKLSLPDGEKTSFLLHAVYCGPKEFQAQPEAVELRDEITRPRYLWIFNKNVWVPKKYKAGVFVVYDEKGIGLDKELDIGVLEKALRSGRKLKNGIKFSEDGKISFAPRETYRNGKMNYKDFTKDGFIIASCKVNGAKNLAEVSQSKHFIHKSLYSSIVEPDKEPIQTLSAVRGYCAGLDFDGDCHGVGWDGCASGVLK